MNKNNIQLAFLAAMALVVFYFTAVSAYKTYNYTQLTAQADATDVEWFVEKLSDERYILRATYSFEGHKGETSLQRTVYRNPWAAEQALKEHQKKKWTAFYSPQNPDHSTIYKVFPFKEVAYCVILWILLFYFLWLGYYVGTKK